MKKFYIAISILIALNVIITSAFVAFMPEEVPVHIGFSGEVDRIGSKYESFILPLLSLVFGSFLLLLAKHGEADNERVLLRANIALQFFMIAFSVFWLSGSLSFDVLDSSHDFGLVVTKFAPIGSGALFIVLGNLLPKSNMNSVFGVRTSWSMSSEELWRKTQRLSGYVFIVSGVVMIVLGLLLDGMLGIFALLALVIICAVVCMVLSYRLYREDS